MLQNWFILLPEFCLLGFFFIAWPVDIFRSEKTSKTFFTLAQFFLLAALAASVLFYNKSVFPSLWQNTPFRTLFKVLAYLLAWAWFYLSSKWFLNKNRSSFKFYMLCFALLFGLGVVASASSLLTLGIAVLLVCFFSYHLILQHWDIERVAETAKIYAVCSALFCLLLWCGIAILYTQSGTFEYVEIRSFFANIDKISPQAYAAVLLILACFMFLMALVPFHTWFIAFISAGILPVCGFFTLVPPLMYICALINLMRDCLPSFIPFATPIICLFAGISLIVGALSANRERNIRSLFAYLFIYCQGFALIGAGNFSSASMMSSFAYIIISVLSLAGVYTVFSGLKSRGEYLSDIDAIKGFYWHRPYMAAAWLVFMFSLIGLAPTLGFLGYMSVINNLITLEQWGSIGLLLAGLIFAAGACLQVVRVIYFEQQTVKYDRTDKAIYICLFLNVLVILMSLINPVWLIRDGLTVLGGVS